MSEEDKKTAANMFLLFGVGFLVMMVLAVFLMAIFPPGVAFGASFVIVFAIGKAISGEKS